MLWWIPFSVSRRKHVRLQPEEPPNTMQVAPSPCNSTSLSVVAQSPLKKELELEYAFAESAFSSRESPDDHSIAGASTRPPSSYSNNTAMSALRSLAQCDEDDVPEAVTPPEEPPPPMMPVRVRTPPSRGRNGSSLQNGQEGASDSSSSQIPQLSPAALLDALRSGHIRAPPVPPIAPLAEARRLETNLVPGRVPTAAQPGAVDNQATVIVQPKLPPPPPPPSQQRWREGS
jgi:hypothetical protein